MNNESTFNKETFAMLLDRAKGDRSINQYANETGVSAAHISRFLRQMIDAPPTPETISKFAEKAWGDVTYRDMMIAAGYINEGSMEQVDSPIIRRKIAMELEREFFQIILTHLYDQSYKWSIKKPEGKLLRPDMVIDIEDETTWFLEFRPNLSGNNRPIPISILLNLYGRVAITELTYTDKFTIVVNSESDFATLMNNQPINLRANLFVMLVDLESRRIIREEKICEY